MLVHVCPSTRRHILDDSDFACGHVLVLSLVTFRLVRWVTKCFRLCSVINGRLCWWSWGNMATEMTGEGDCVRIVRWQQRWQVEVITCG
jgi:hypothetical protein